MIIKNGEKKIEKKNLDKKDIFAHNVQKVFAAKICGSSSFAELSGRKIPGWFFYNLIRWLFLVQQNEQNLYIIVIQTLIVFANSKSLLQSSFI